MSTTPSGETKDLILNALDDYFMGAVDGLERPKFSPEAGLIAETWMEGQETSEEEEQRIREEDGVRMKEIILAALSSYEYKVLDESPTVSDDLYGALRHSQKWIEILEPGKDIY